MPAGASETMFGALRNIFRLLRIARTLARHDALFPFENAGIAPGLIALVRLISGRRPPALRAARPGQRLAAALQRLGPSFIKAGQTLATRADLVGEEVATDLSALQDQLPPFPAAQARATIEAEFGRPLAELFEEFDDEPVAAASIAQVHFARTRTPVRVAPVLPGVVPEADSDNDEDNDEGEGVRAVAVKVLRPGIVEAFARDLDLFYWIARMIERTRPDLRRLKPVEVIDIFAESVAVEMDLRLEAAAASELAQNFAGDPSFRVPAVDWERTSRRVLTTARIDGIRIDRRDALIAAGHDPDEILANAAAAFFNQAFRDGFFHADQHPGNIFVAADGALEVVDFGIMGRLDRKTRTYLADMLLGFLNRDYRRVAEVHFEAGYVPMHKSLDAFTQAARSIGEPILGRPLNEISIGRLLGQLFQVTEAFEMETQPQLLLLQKTMVVTEGVGRMLNPDLNIWALARPLIEEWMRATRGPEARIRESASEISEALERLPRLLRDVGRTVDTLSAGGLRLHPDTVRTLKAEEGRANPLIWPLWAAVALLALGLLVVL